MSWAPPNGPCPKSPSNKPAAIWSLPYWEKVTFPWLVRVHSFWEDSQQWFGGKRQGKVYYSCFQVQFEMMHLIHYASKHASTLLGISVYLVSNLPIQAHCLFQKVSFIQFSSVARSCPTLCDLVRQALLSKGFPRQEYWSGLPFPPPGDLPKPGIKPASPALAGRFYTTVSPGKPPALCNH